jgi:hypothetical protein
MKNFVKVIALATVACMLLSVSAFAAVTPAPETDEITLDVVAGAGEEVALLVVDKDATLASLQDSEIEYIGQATADAVTGVANFGTFTVKNADAIVDIYVGSTTLSATGAQKIGDDIDLKGVTKITIATEGQAKFMETGEGKGGKTAFAAALNIVVPAELNVSKMVWAFYDATATDWFYSTAIDGPGTVAEGALQLAAAFDNYDANRVAKNITDVAAIFLTGDAANEDNVHYVGADEATLKADYVAK